MGEVQVCEKIHAIRYPDTAFFQRGGPTRFLKKINIGGDFSLRLPESFHARAQQLPLAVIRRRRAR